VNPKLARQLERRAKLVEAGQPIDWAHAEALAFASLLADGVPIRLTGQDTERGTFSQRHLALHDVETDDRYVPICHLEESQAPFEIHNSPLSELAAMGFEYGYSVVTPRALVLWEAQFGDFANAAQVIIDQFIAAGRAKWDQLSRLVLLLPHGYEGQGPEHSSARIERFLQLCAEDNMRVANATTAAQYFHLLRRQALIGERRPLIIMTPKSLLRHPRAASRAAEFVDGAFQLVLGDDAIASAHADVRRLVFCSGKVYYDLAAAREERGAAHVAFVRVEQLYPFPAELVRDWIERFGAAEDIVWAQEEPVNMGAWSFIEPRLRELAGGRPLRYIGRPERASPAEGYAADHDVEQGRIVDAVLALPAGGRRARTSKKGLQEEQSS
jgi:2-oxoglutarate dehydrogenase E1 component